MDSRVTHGITAGAWEKTALGGDGGRHRMDDSGDGSRVNGQARYDRPLIPHWKTISEALLKTAEIGGKNVMTRWGNLLP